MNRLDENEQISYFPVSSVGTGQPVRTNHTNDHAGTPNLFMSSGTTVSEPTNETVYTIVRRLQLRSYRGSPLRLVRF